MRSSSPARSTPQTQPRRIARQVFEEVEEIITLERTGKVIADTA